MTSKILYLGTLINSDVQEWYDLAYYSRAADNKKRGIIDSLQACDAEVTVVSPVFINNNSFQYHQSRTIVDDELGVKCHIPSTVDIYGLNYLFLALTTTVLTLKLLFGDEYDATLFYDFKLETTIPALLGSLLCSVPMILEYEDGLFLHDNTVIRWTSKVLRPTAGRIVDGAACVNEPLADLIPTDNTTIVRGFPSIGMPDELPEPGYETDRTTVMFAGRFDNVRGINTFLEVAPQVDREDVAFWVSGYGPDEELERVERRIEDLNDDRFSYFGTLPWDEYRNRIVSADVIVNFQDPYHEISEYTFPSKLLDFMSAGAAIVSTDMSDLRRYFDDKMLVAGMTNDELLDGLETTIERHDTDEIRERSDRARQWVETDCSRETVGAKLLDLVENTDQT